VIRRIIVGLVGLVLVVLLAAAGTAYWFLSGDGVRLALERQASAWLGQPVRIRAASTQFFPRLGIQLTDVTVGEPVSLSLASIDLSTNFRALIGRRVEDAEVTVSDSRIQMPLPRARPAGETAASNGADPIRLVSVRSIALSSVRLVSRGQEIVVNAESALEGTRLTVRRFDAQSGKTNLQAEGTVDLAPRVDATLRIKADTLDVDELLALADAFTPEEEAGPEAGPDFRISARVSAERATAGGVDVRQFATVMEADGDRITLSPLTFQLFGGRYQGSLAARLGDAIQATLESRIIDIDLGQLAAFGGVEGAVTGTLSGAGTFSGRGADFAEVLRTARGDGTASAHEGTIQRLNLIRTVVLFFGRPAPDTAAATDAFDRIDARFSLAGGTFNANAFALRSADADIVGSGTLDVSSKELAGQLDLSLSEALSAQAGTDFRRYTREGNRIVLPARMGGTLGQPRLRIDAAAAVQRGLRNEVQRRLGGLLDQFGK
jgi:uncharacterized protein involved in outer membrane biogenesis